MSGKTKLTTVCDCGPDCLDLGRANGCRYALADQGTDRCVGDGKPCYVGANTDDAHWRCGTSGCGSDYLAGRAALSQGEE